MFLNRTEPRSIESKLVLLFIPAALLLLGCGLGVFYWMVVRHAFEEDNAVLADKMFALSADLKTENGPALLHDEANGRRSGEHAAYSIRLLDDNGRVIAETPKMGQLLPVDTFPAPQESRSPLNPKNFRARGKSFSLVAISQRAPDGKSYNVQLAQDRSTDEEFSRNFGWLVAAVFAGGILASTVIAITVTRRGLQPLGQMARALERISPAHFNEKVVPARWPRELQPLAHAFDQMLDRLENSFTRLSQFSADLAHELRTPIANILGEAQVALTRQRSSEEYREVIESTVAECEHLSVIVDNLLFLARAEAADKQIQPRLLDGRLAIEKIAAYYQTVAEDRHIAIRCDGQGSFFVDPVLFERALSNLVDNALRFTPERGSIEMVVAEKGNQGQVSVSDTGAGIAPEHLPRVFDRFYRADPARSSHGTGLGLSLVKSIVDLHGGSAAIQSEVDGGTTVTLIFPNRT